MEDAKEDHVVVNMTKAETVVVVLLTEEALVDHHSAEKDLVQMDQQVKVTLLVKNESQTGEAIQEESVDCLLTEQGHLILKTEEVKKHNMT